jgi:hypothetical protein
MDRSLLADDPGEPASQVVAATRDSATGG